MTTIERLEDALPDLLGDLGRADASLLIADVLADTEGLRQRRGIALPELPGVERLRLRFGRRPIALRLVIAIGLLVLALAAAAIAGGLRRPTPIPTTWVRAGQLDSSVGVETAIALRDGRILVGGSSGSSSLAKLFDPRSGVMTTIPSGFSRVDLQGAAILTDGRIFLLGWQEVGTGAEGRSLAWLLDPVSGQVSPPVETVRPRFEATVVAVKDSVYLLGGLNNPEAALPETSIERFDLASRSFTVTVTQADVHAGDVAMALPDGTVLVAGGQRVGLLDPLTGDATALGTLPSARGATSILRRADGRILVIPGEGIGTCGRHGIDPTVPVLFDPTTRTLEPARPLPHAVRAAVSLADGRLVIAGAWQAMTQGCADGSSYLHDAWIGIHDPITGATSESLNPMTGTGDLPIDPDGPIAAAVLLPDGRVALISATANGGGPYAIDLLTVGSR
jgi:hypothetical protein